jgi:hypothetical protein
LLLDFAGAQTLDPRITFTRASTATYYNSAGVLTTTGFNLLLYSEQFDNAWWFKSRATATANVIVSPDGTVDADKLTEDTTASNTHYIATTEYSTVSGTSYTWSVYLKAGERTKARVALQMFFTGSAYPTTNPRVNVDLTTGTLSGANGTIATSITNAGNGWYRVTVSATANATQADQLAGVFLLDDAGNQTYTGDGTSGLFIWGAQLETGLTATSYIPTQAATSGAPRFDYNPTTLAPLGLLIEEQRTNLLLYSTNLSIGWTRGTAATWALNAAIAPDGTMTALGVDGISGTSRTGVGGAALFTTGQSVTGGAAVTVSVYVRAKTGTASNVCLRISETGGNNTIGPGNTIGTAWQRISLTVTTAAGATAASFTFGTTTGTANLFIWGAQQEVGAFATSYIPTVASQVTRSADVAVMTGTNFSDWYNQAEGTLYAEWNSVGSLSDNRIIYALSDGTFSNVNYLTAATAGAANQSVYTIRSSNTSQASIAVPGAYTNYAYRKTAAVYKVNDFALSGDGGAVAVDTSGLLPVGVDRLALGTSWTAGTNFINGHISQIAYYPRRLANSELQAITA